MAEIFNNGKRNWDLVPAGFKKLLWLALVAVIIFLALSIKGCVDGHNKEDYWFDKWKNADKERLQVIENKLGQLSFIAGVTKANNSQINDYVKSDSALRILTKKYSDLLAVVSKKMGVYVDTIQVRFKETDTLPCADFERIDSVKNRYYSFNYFLNKRKFMIENLSFPDTVYTIIGEKKSGFLGMKRNYVVEETHSNKYVKIQSMTPVVKFKKQRWITWTCIGAAAGITGGYFLFK